MKKAYLLQFVFIVTQLINAQIATVIPFSSSIAQTSVADSKNWSAFNNPSMLGYIRQPEIGMGYGNRFLLSQLSSKTVQAGIPTQLLNIGLSYNYFGYSLYHEMQYGIGFARNYADRFALGLQFNYYSAYFSASNSYRGAFLPQIGISTKLSHHLQLGFSTYNPFQSNIKTDLVVKRIPSIFSLGTEYEFSNDLIWRTQIDKEVSSNYRFATGFDYHMLPPVEIKLGIYSLDYLVPCLGLGFISGSLAIDFNCEMHPLLGLSTFASIKYRYNK